MRLATLLFVPLALLGCATAGQAPSRGSQSNAQQYSDTAQFQRVSTP
jgi:hypothetical protein